ncbi:MAG TPA: hypothetical protein GXX38_04850 [Clostridia bacterium]|jgi:hypothetical protein|nr:hypothetical protein [Clostridia bacterium]
MDPKLQNNNSDSFKNETDDLKPTTSQIPGELDYGDYTKCRALKNCNYLDCPYRRDMFMFN